MIITSRHFLGKDFLSIKQPRKNTQIAPISNSANNSILSFCSAKFFSL